MLYVSVMCSVYNWLLITLVQCYMVTLVIYTISLWLLVHFKFILLLVTSVITTVQQLINFLWWYWNTGNTTLLMLGEWFGTLVLLIVVRSTCYYMYYDDSGHLSFVQYNIIDAYAHIYVGTYMDTYIHACNVCIYMHNAYVYTYVCNTLCGDINASKLWYINWYIIYLLLVCA